MMNHATRDKTVAAAHKAMRPAPEMITAWKEQERVLAELLGPTKAPVAERPNPVIPRARSERRSQWFVV